MTNDSLIACAPNQVLALKTIRLHIEQGRFADALEALKEYGRLYAAYALAEVEKTRTSASQEALVREMEAIRSLCTVRYQAYQYCKEGEPGYRECGDMAVDVTAYIGEIRDYLDKAIAAMPGGSATVAPAPVETDRQGSAAIPESEVEYRKALGAMAEKHAAREASGVGAENEVAKLIEKTINEWLDSVGTNVGGQHNEEKTARWFLAGNINHAIRPYLRQTVSANRNDQFKKLCKLGTPINCLIGAARSAEGMDRYHDVRKEWVDNILAHAESAKQAWDKIVEMFDDED